MPRELREWDAGMKNNHEMHRRRKIYNGGFSTRE